MAITETQNYQKVYNFRVADFHTYYVGGPEWGYDVWAHNTCKKFNLNSNDAVSIFGVYKIYVNSVLHKIGKANLVRKSPSGVPIRIISQVRRLVREAKIAGIPREQFKVAYETYKLGETTTKKAKITEYKSLVKYFKKTGLIPPGNRKSFFGV